jgi:heme oxygenase
MFREADPLRVPLNGGSTAMNPRRPRLSARLCLRDATASRHRTVESLMHLDCRLTCERYRRVLILFHGVFAPTEAALAEWASAEGRAGVVEPRAECAKADVLEMGSQTGLADGGNREAAIAPLTRGGAGEPEALGYAYVLAGSAMGAATLLPRVKRALPDAPTAFLESADPRVWRGFSVMLDGALDTHVRRDRAVRGAQSVFDAFAALARSLPDE